MNKNKGHIHCPVNGWDCPYYKENGICVYLDCCYCGEDNPIESDNIRIEW